jgi:hypothetical protein
MAGTLQDRLVKELGRDGASTIDQAKIVSRNTDIFTGHQKRESG